MSLSAQKALVITPGEPAGIGPDIVLNLLAQSPELPLTIIADSTLLETRAKQLKLNLSIDQLSIQHVPLTTPCQPGQLNVANAPYVLDCLHQATQACLSGNYHGLVTGPVHKGIINDANIAFSGHTEYLAQLTNTPLPVMLFVANTLRVALLTTHLPLSAVPSAVTTHRLHNTIKILTRDLTQRFGITKPRIAVCGLNPHAGENGYLGREEIDIIEPALEQLRQQSYHILGPLPADTAFTPHHLDQCDVILGMYHDQVLPVVKAQYFSSAVNVTLGLPFIRTSVDHGTALNLAGTGQADAANLYAAVKLAMVLREDDAT